MLTLADEPNAAARARALVAFETEIAKVHWTQVQNRDAEKTYNKMSLAQLSRTAPGFDFGGYFKARGANVSDVVIGQLIAVLSALPIVSR